MNHSQWYKKPEMIVALSALLISVVTTVVGVYSAYIDRAYARASMWPRLELARSYSTNHFEYIVTNAGNGPAIIQHGIVSYKSKPIKKWKDITDLPTSYVQSHIGNKILPSQQIVKPMKYKGSSDILLEADKWVDIELCYCSIYDECWIADRSNTTKAVDACTVDEKNRFLQ